MNHQKAIEILEKHSLKSESTDKVAQIYIKHIQKTKIFDLPFFKKKPRKQKQITPEIKYFKYRRPIKLKPLFSEIASIEEDYEIYSLKDSFSIHKFNDNIKTIHKTNEKSNPTSRNKYSRSRSRSRSRSKENQIENFKNKVIIQDIRLEPVQEKYKNDPFLIEAVQNQNSMKWLGNGQIWDKEKLEKNLQWGESDWQHFTQKIKEQENYFHEYFQWLCIIKYQDKETKETHENAVGIISLIWKKLGMFSQDNLFYGRQVLNRKFQRMGIGSIIMSDLLWEQIDMHQINIDKFYNVVHSKNIAAQKMCHKANGICIGHYRLLGEKYDIYEFSHPKIIIQESLLQQQTQEEYKHNSEQESKEQCYEKDYIFEEKQQQQNEEI